MQLLITPLIAVQRVFLFQFNMSDHKDKIVKEQEAPTHNDGEAIWDLVIDDMKARDKEGFRRYKTRLQAFNGRNALVDSYQEALDQIVYLRQFIKEREEMIQVLKFYASKEKWQSYEGLPTEIDCDVGVKARELLEKLGEK